MFSFLNAETVILGHAAHLRTQLQRPGSSLPVLELLLLLLLAPTITRQLCRTSTSSHLQCCNCCCLQVADVFPLHLAGHKSLTAQASGSMVTKGLHTELAYSLSGTKHVRHQAANL